MCVLQALVQLEDHLLSSEVEFPSHLIDPSPFQLVEMTSLYKVVHYKKYFLWWITYSLSLQVHSLFSLLSLSHAYVTSLGKLVGVVTLTDVSEYTLVFLKVSLFALHFSVSRCH